MNELQAYVDSLPSMLSEEEKKKLVKQWKIDNKWGEEKPEPVGTGTVLKSENITYGGEAVEKVLEAVKTEGDAAGAGVEPVKAEAPVDSTELALEDGSSELTIKEELDKKKDIATMSFGEKLLIDLRKGSTTLGEMIASVPETLYDIFALPQNILAKATGLNIEASSKKFKEDNSLGNPVLEFYEAESAKLQESQDIYNKANYDHQSIYKNFQEGNYSDGFKQLASGLTESAPISMSIMIGGSAVSTGKLAAGSTVAFAGPEIKEQREKNPGQSEAESIIKGLGLAGAESVFSSIGTGTVGKVYKDILLKEGKEEGIKIFRQGLIDMYRSALTKYGAPASMLGEGVEEVATTITQNMINGIPAFENVADSFIQGVGGGVTYGAPINTAQAVKAVKSGITNSKINSELGNSNYNSIADAFNVETSTSSTEINISQIAGSQQAIDAKVDKQVEAGEITADQANDIKLRAREVQGSVNRLKPLGISIENQPALVDLMIEQKNLKNTIKQVDNSSLTKAESERLTEIDKELSDIVVADKTEKVEKGARVIADQLNVGFETFENEADMASAIETLKEQGGKVDTKNSQDYGSFVVMPDGKKIVILNKESAAEDNVMDTAGHETGHILIYESVKNNPEAAIALGTSLLEELKNSKDITFTNSKFLDRFNQYVEDTDISKADTMEEVLTLASEGLANGDIVFNEKATTKIGDFIRRALSAIGLNVKFKTGKDVLNFVRDYNKSIQKGKGLSKGLEKAATKGAEVNIKVPTEIETEIESDDAKASKKTVEPLEQAARNKELVQKAKDGDIIAGQNLVDENSGLILDLLKFNPDVTKDSGVDADALLQAVKDAATPGLANLVFPGRYREESDTKRTGATSLLNEYKESSGEVSTFLGRLKQRQAEIYTAAGLDPNKYNIESLDTAEAKQITNEETEETSEPSNEASTNQIDVTTFGPAKNKKVALEKIIKIEKGERLNFKTLNNKYFNEVSEEIFGIDGKKVRGNVSLNYGNSKKTDYSEANALQNIFKNSENVRSLVKTMPPYNVATKEATINEQGESIDVSRDTYGRALGINPTVLKTFYQKVNRSIPGISNPKGRSLGKSTQTDVFELKPEFRGNVDNDVITELQSSVGVNKGELSVPIKGPARTEFGSVLTGLSKMYVDNVINTIGRSKLDSKQAKADLAAGKSKSMASKRIETEADMPSDLVAKFQEISILKNKKQLASNLKFSSPPINESNRVAQQKAMQKAVVKHKLDTATIEAGMMGSGGKQTFYGVKGGKMYSSAKTTDGKFVEINTEGITNWVAKPSRLYYGKSDPAYKKLIKSAQVYNGPKTKKISPIRAFSTNPKTKADAEQESKDNMTVLDHVVNQLTDAVADGMSLDIAAVIIIQSYQATSGLVKIAAPFKYRSIEMRYGGPKSKKQQREGKKYREEHNPPASVVGASILLAIKNNAAAPVMKKIKENYYQTQLSKFDDDLLDQAKLDSTLVKGQSIFDNPITRFAAAGIDVNTLKNPDTGKTVAEESEFGIDPKIYAGYNVNEKVQASNIQNEAILKTIENPDYKVAKVIKASLPLVKGKSMASKRNGDLIPKAIAYDQSITVQKGINALEKTDKALNNARKLDAPVKKIRVFDFDDTLARSKSMVIVNMPDGSSKKINATQFAQQAADLESQGAEFDFAEFSEVVEGKKGPLFEVAQKIADVRGTEDVFILTARPQNADGPIKAFMKANGIDIPLKNITGLGDGTAQAKAGWMMGKAAEGYNDFYFADDAIKNVQAVKDVLSQIDVKSEVQLAKASKRITFDTIVNDMIEDSSGIETYKQYSAARAQTVGASKGRFNFFIPASAEDFTGLLYKMLGKGKKGDAQMAFLKTNLLDPYDRAESAVTQAKIAAANDFKALKQNLKTLPKSLSKPTGIGGFTFSHAVRVAVWSKQGMDIPGLSKRDIEELNNFVDNNAELSVFTDELMKIQKGKPYPKPGKSWLGGNITGDIINDINKVNRAEYQQEWRENVDIIFSEDNMNKMEAAYGTRWRKATEDSLRRMKSGSNRPPGGNSVTDGLLDWLNNSVGAVMFLNTRSALLQTISAVNFINWGDNNIVKAGVAFANQKQFWGDFMTLMNSDYLVERRNGLKINVSESEIADAVRDSKNKVKSAIAFLLSKGFVMTRFADSFAIATGGSTFYRNRVKALVGKGMEQKAAEAQAFEDFRQIAEESQQSSNPNRISQQQASGAGRVILAWANTPMQYARIQKRASQDLINGRGDWKTNVSKIVYYGAVQNLIFNSLQQAVFALGFGEDEDEEEQNAKKSEKISRVANGMIDSQLKGLGIGGAAVVALKSTLMELGKQYSKDRPKYEEAVFDLLGFSPPLGSKVQKINGGLRSFSWNMKDIKSKGFSLDNPSYLAGAQITTGLTNIPLDRVIKKINSMRGIVNEQSSLWQKVALGLGWSTWDVGLGYYGGFDAAKVLTPEEEKVKEIDDMKKLTKTKEQVDMLLDLGLTKKEIKALGKEQSRVEKIIELQNAEAEPKKEAKVKEEIKEETKPTPEVKAKPKTESVERRLRRQFDSIKDENKPDQVKTLLKFGLTKKEIRTLQYEKNRVNKILELMEKNK